MKEDCLHMVSGWQEIIAICISLLSPLVGGADSTG